ncbi:hypothetical protein [Butyrivibrio sp. WCD3002]|uniref:hypothetical protein n=1 Tax=Butyrivibrio sp. WCD3002 TaxID=1280676 RepID=UPI0004222296
MEMMRILRFLKFLPVIVYSYVWYYCQSRISYEVSSYPDWFTSVILLSLILSVIVVIWHLILCIIGKHTGSETTIYSIVMKLVPIYACVEMCVLMAIGLIIPIYGWMASAIVYAYLFSIMLMTGTIQIGTIICLLREKRISIVGAVIMGILSYFIVLDIPVSIYLCVAARRHRTRNVENTAGIVGEI